MTLSAGSAVDARPESGNNESTPRRRGVLEPGWPIILLFAGIPLWWVLGAFQIVFFVLAVPMLVYLLRRRRVLVPDGFGLWLLLLIWVLGGAVVLQVDAPGAVPGADMDRYLTFGFRFGWYLCATIALLYVLNTRKFLRSDRIAFALGCMFVSMVAAGLLSIAVPKLEFITPIEMALPGGLASNEFVRSLVHAQLAQLQDFLGYVEPRVSAPFPYANQWGIAMVATAPHFVVGWWARGGVYRFLTPAIGAIAIIPIISSLNRGMWVAFVVMLLYALVRSGLHRRPAVLLGALGTLVVVGVLVARSPLGALLVDRLTTPHSNEGRASLGTLTVQSTLEGSPLLGFGGTRDVQGNFNSIAAGSTAACPSCSPSPLGTQGNLWEMIFGTGFVGLLLYFGFMTGQLLRYLRVRTPLAIAAHCTIIAALVTSPVYNLVHPVLVVLLVALGILVRQGERPPTRQFGDMLAPVRRSLPIVLAAVILGAGTGAVVQWQRGTTAVATQRVLVSDADLLGAPSARPLTLDSEALLVTSDRVLSNVAQRTGIDPAELAGRIQIAAQPNTRILVIQFRAATLETAQAQVATLAEEYLKLRSTMAGEAREDVRAQLNAELDSLAIAISTAQQAVNRGDTLNQDLGESLASLQQRSQSLAATLAGLEGDLDVGRLLGAARVTTTLDPWVVSIGSGGMLGGLLGLCIGWMTAGRLRWLHAFGRTPTDLPIVERVPARNGVITQHSVERAAQVVAIYTPLAGVLGAPAGGPSRQLAAQLDARLVGRQHRQGRRVLLLTSRSSPYGNLDQARRSAERTGLNPVGVIRVDD